MLALALGSNLGSREYYLRSAIIALGQTIRIVRVSRFVSSSPVDSPSGSPDYLNAALTGTTPLSLAELLSFTQDIEVSLGRVNKGGNRPRTIDIDLIFFGADRIRTRELTIPHPRWAERTFVREPLRAIGAPWVALAARG